MEQLNGTVEEFEGRLTKTEELTQYTGDEGISMRQQLERHFVEMHMKRDAVQTDTTDFIQLLNVKMENGLQTLADRQQQMNATATQLVAELQTEFKKTGRQPTDRHSNTRRTAEKVV